MESYSELLHEPAEAVTQRCSAKKVFLEISQNSQDNTCARVCFLINLQETLSLVFSCEFCEILRTSFFTEHIRWLLLKLHVSFHLFFLRSMFSLKWQNHKFSSLHNKWSFPLRISSENVNICWRNPSWKTSFFVQWLLCLNFGLVHSGT